MNTHLQTASIILLFAGFVVAIYFTPIITIVSMLILFLYASLYSEIKQTEEQKKNEKKTTRENN